MADRRPRGDPYEILGIRRDASSADISRAYRRLARELHPDSHPADSAAADRFRAVAAAYEVLSDPAQRAAHNNRATHDQRPWHGPVPPAPGARRGTSFSHATSQLRPLGTADTAGWLFPLPANDPVRPGPVRIEPLPESVPALRDDAAVWLAELLQLISQQARGGRYRPW